jgi:predicted RNA methylase
MLALYATRGKPINAAIYNEVFYDLGSGKGRILCVMARRPFKKVVGVELLESLCEVAKRNAIHMRGRKAPIEIYCEDAARADLSDGTVYCMFNPFGITTLREVIEHIKSSLSTNPRGITIVYYNAVHEDILRSCEWLQMSYVFHTATGRRVSFWRNLNSEHA